MYKIYNQGLGPQKIGSINNTRNGDTDVRTEVGEDSTTLDEYISLRIVTTEDMEDTVSKFS
jgi:hypothetical protein